MAVPQADKPSLSFSATLAPTLFADMAKHGNRTNNTSPKLAPNSSFAWNLGRMTFCGTNYAVPLVKFGDALLQQQTEVTKAEWED
eukprot:5032085-Amphidinium_carterae.1